VQRTRGEWNRRRTQSVTTGAHVPPAAGCGSAAAGGCPSPGGSWSVGPGRRQQQRQVTPAWPQPLLPVLAGVCGREHSHWQQAGWLLWPQPAYQPQLQTTHPQQQSGVMGCSQQQPLPAAAVRGASRTRGALKGWTTETVLMRSGRRQLCPGRAHLIASGRQGPEAAGGGAGTAAAGAMGLELAAATWVLEAQR
jgi:hypothetical protein